MTEDHLKLQQEHDESHEETLKVLVETDKALENAQQIISESRLRLQEATRKYEERLHGPKNPRSD